MTSKVRKARRVFSRGGEHIERWKQICKENNKELEGYVFSVDGKEYSRSNLHRHWQKIMKLADINEDRKEQLVPYSLRHFMITERVKSGLSFNQIAPNEKFAADKLSLSTLLKTARENNSPLVTTPSPVSVQP